MAKKIPVSAVLSFWSIKGIAIPLSSHAKKFLFLNLANAYFLKRTDFFHIFKPFKKPVNSQRALANASLKLLMQIVPLRLRQAKAQQLTTVIHLTEDYGQGTLAVKAMFSYKICITWLVKKAGVVANATSKRRVTVLFHWECAQKKNLIIY